MRSYGRRRGFTIVELLVVITVIIILAGIAVPVILGMMDISGRVKCSNNMRQIGLFIQQATLKDKVYPSGGTDPLSGDLGTVVSDSRLMICPSRDADSPSYSATSYIYLGNMTGAYYTCGCSSCTSGESTGKRIWSLYWSGVDYAGGHNNDASQFKSLPLAENVRFQNKLRANIDPTAVDSGGNPTAWESQTQPTIPTHQDTDTFHTYDVKKYRTQRALRMVPETPEDSSASIPIAADVCYIYYSPWTTLANSSGWTNYHKEHINDSTDMENHLRTNHCTGTGSSKANWGVNVLYADCSVRWKTWDEIRFQVLDPNNNRFFFF